MAASTTRERAPFGRADAHANKNTCILTNFSLSTIEYIYTRCIKLSRNRFNCLLRPSSHHLPLMAHTPQPSIDLILAILHVYQHDTKSITIMYTS